jgi:hypothetical protein
VSLCTGDRRPALEPVMTKQPNIWIGTPEDITAGVDSGDLRKPGAVFMIIGERGRLTRQQAERMGAQWQSHVTRHPNGVFAFTVEGYDDDPRELWQIDEVAHYGREWACFAGMNNLTAAARLVGPQSASGRQMPDLNNLGLLAACGAFGEELKAVALAAVSPQTTSN